MKIRWLLACALVALPALARERAVVVYPREHRFLHGLFYTPHQRALLADLRRRYDVDVHEQVATADELFAIDVRGAALLLISGHGEPFGISLTDDRHVRTIDSSQRQRLASLIDSLDPNATIVLQSCETGRGFAWLVKELAGPRRHVIAAKGTIPRDGLLLRSVDPLQIDIVCDDDGQSWDCAIRL